MITYRLAESRDAEAFTEWCGDNPDIPEIDIAAAQDDTALVLAFERDGIVLCYLPFYFLDDGNIRIAFINFSPSLTTMDKARVLNVMLKTTTDLARKSKATTISTLTKEGYGIAEWAKKKGFVAGTYEGTRQVFSLGVN